MADVLASVALGVAGFFLPGIFKAFVTRKRCMTLGAREAKDAFIYESLFDPLSMWRWFDQPKEMKDKEESTSGDDETAVKQGIGISDYKVLIFPIVLALFTQVSLILLQFASTQEVVGMVGVQGPGVTLSISPMPSEEQLQNPRVSRCLPTPTGPESLSSITTCFDTFFLLAGYSELSNDKYRVRITRTFASLDEKDLIIFGLEFGSEIFVRAIQILPRILTRSGREAFVVVNEEDIDKNNEALLGLIENFLLPNQGCQRSFIEKFRNTEYQTNWDVTFDCFGPPYALGNNIETSSKFNKLSNLLADNFQINGRSKYFEDASDATIAVGSLEEFEIEYSTSLQRVLSDWAIVLILVIILLLKLLTDLVFGEDVLYKTAILVDELSAQETNNPRKCTTLLRAKGKLTFDHGTYLLERHPVAPPGEAQGATEGGDASLNDTGSEDSVDEKSNPPSDVLPITSCDQTKPKKKSKSVPYSSNIYQMMKSADSQQQFDC